MRKKRFSRLGKTKKEPLEVDITSLLDILVILLVFLLKSYNASDLTLDVVERLELPPSKSDIMGQMAITVQVNKDRNLWIDNSPMGKIEESGEIITNLKDRLVELKKVRDDELKLLEARAPASISEEEALAKRKQTNKMVNIVLDQELPYAVLRKVMHTSATVGLSEFKFIVQGNLE